MHFLYSSCISTVYKFMPEYFEWNNNSLYFWPQEPSTLVEPIVPPSPSNDQLAYASMQTLITATEQLPNAIQEPPNADLLSPTLVSEAVVPTDNMAFNFTNANPWWVVFFLFTFFNFSCTKFLHEKNVLHVFLYDDDCHNGGEEEGWVWKILRRGRECSLRGNSATQSAIHCTMLKRGWVEIRHERFENSGNVFGVVVFLSCVRMNLSIKWNLVWKVVIAELL